MRSFLDIDQALASIPTDLVRLLASVEYGRGREELFRTQAPQVLERLAARTRFDSITASSAIENVVVDDDRALKLLREPTADEGARDRRIAPDGLMAPRNTVRAARKPRVYPAGAGASRR